jgi:tRNA1Val (adenine37-N6)-methyltransferase
MGNTLFQFKQFAVEQGKCAMKISTDAVLLGALANLNEPKEILDIGTGTGVLALMLAQRFTKANVTGIEIEEGSFEQAKENFMTSPWSLRINAVLADFKEYAVQNKKSFDLIVANPPYYPNHLLTKDKNKNIALHQESLNFEELIIGVKNLLSTNGRFWLILPPDQMKIFDEIAVKSELSAQFILSVFDKPGAKIIRTIAFYSFRETLNVQKETFFIKEESGKYSDMYVQLLKDFLLKL